MTIKKQLHVEALAGLSVARPAPVTNRRNTVAVDEQAEWEQITGVLPQRMEPAANVPARIVFRRHTTAIERSDLGVPPVDMGVFDMGGIASAIDNLETDWYQRSARRPVFDDIEAPIFAPPMASIHAGQSGNMFMNHSLIDNESFIHETIPACSTPLRSTQRKPVPSLIPIVRVSRGVEEPASNNDSSSSDVEEPGELPNLATHPLEFAKFLAKKLGKP